MMTLLDVRDELAVAKNFVAALHLACDSRILAGRERAALCEVSNAAREKLEAICTALDQILSGRPIAAGKSEP